MMSHQSSIPQGFTLIELVMVIVLLGILSAFALPRFAGLSTEASAAANDGVGGAFKSAISLAHAVWLAGGYNGPVDNLELYGSGSVTLDMNSAGWPAQSFPPFEVFPTLNNFHDCISVWSAVLSEGAPTVDIDASEDYQVTYNSNTCTYTLVAEPRFSVFYDSNTGEVIVDSDL